MSTNSEDFLEFAFDFALGAKKTLGQRLKAPKISRSYFTKNIKNRTQPFMKSVFLGFP